MSVLWMQLQQQSDYEYDYRATHSTSQSLVSINDEAGAIQLMLVVQSPIKGNFCVRHVPLNNYTRWVGCGCVEGMQLQIRGDCARIIKRHDSSTLFYPGKK